MGAYLSQPNTTKTSSDGGNGNLSYGFSAMQGWRVSMEVKLKKKLTSDHNLLMLRSVIGPQGCLLSKIIPT